MADFGARGLCGAAGQRRAAELDGALIAQRVDACYRTVLAGRPTAWRSGMSQP